ncbi:MAG: hypothetical protein K8R87_06280, partial [Verrucomicrobia bacterium]|nr:hypothetical protein [Verrucomicrobiota bacterium]
AKDEPAKKNMLDPRNWFRGKDKPVGETQKGKTTEKNGAADNKNSPDAKTVSRTVSLPIDEFNRVWKRDDRDKIFQRTINQLNTVKVQAHPLYRPLIGEYIATVRLLISGKQNGVAEKLVSLREQQAVIQQMARAVESHMDWYEASQTKSYSGVFDDYLKLSDQIDHEIRTRQRIQRVITSAANDGSTPKISHRRRAQHHSCMG